MESEKSKNLAKFLRKIKHINLILFVRKSNDYRDNFITKDMILMFKDMFGEEFMKITAFVYTHHNNS